MESGVYSLEIRSDDICLYLNSCDCAQLQALVIDRYTRCNLVWLATIVLVRADGHGTNEIMLRVRKSKPTVWRWQARSIARAAGLNQMEDTCEKPLLCHACKKEIDLRGEI